MKIVRFITEYKVARKNVHLTIKIGDAQIGGHVVSLGTKRLALDRDIKELKIGTGSAIKKKTLKIKSIISDVNDKTNSTSISYKLSGGAASKTHTVKEKVETDGDAIIYRTEINFI